MTVTRLWQQEYTCRSKRGRRNSKNSLALCILNSITSPPPLCPCYFSLQFPYQSFRITFPQGALSLGCEHIARCVFGCTQVITSLIILSVLKQVGVKQKAVVISGTPVLGFKEIQIMINLSPMLCNFIKM